MTGASDTPAPMGEDDLVARLHDSSTACVEGSAVLAKRKSVLSGNFMIIGGLFTKAADRITKLEARLREAEATIGALREGLEHTTELLVDTWSTAMGGDPERELAVVRARALLKDTDHAE